MTGIRVFGGIRGMTNAIPRREFLSRSSLLAASLSATPLLGRAEEIASLKGRVYKTLKIGMVKGGDTLAEKFAIAKRAGFEGIELGLPGNDPAEAQAATAATGLPVDGSVCAAHWQVRHTDQDDSVRAEALKNLKAALRETAEAGGHTVLLVVGHGNDGTEKEIWNRSISNIRQAIPLAARLGVTIAVENVWNHFCYDHEGGSDQSAAKFAQYIDEFDSPWVGMQFDIGNHWKYGATGDWIRTLGKRIVKLDVKGFSRAKDKFVAIGEGDIDFADVQSALRQIGYHGWCAAEVGGGDEPYLAGVAAQMDQAFGLS